MRSYLRSYSSKRLATVLTIFLSDSRTYDGTQCAAIEDCCRARTISPRGLNCFLRDPVEGTCVELVSEHWPIRCHSSVEVEITRGEPALQDLPRGRTEHAAKCARKVCRIGEPGRAGCVRNGLPPRELSGATLQPQPENIR